MAYVSPVQVAEYVGTPDIADTVLLADAVAVASKQVDLHCGRTFALAGDTATPRVFGVGSAYLARVDDFATDTDLVVATDENDDGTFEITWTAADYELQPFGARLEDGSPGVYYRIAATDSRAFPINTKRRGILRVTARWGWPEVPYAVTQATLELAKDAYNARLNRGGVIIDGGTGAVVSVRANRTAANYLQPYVRVDRKG
jgi:hypothetical protein